jgi:hypothetical protein
VGTRVFVFFLTKLFLLHPWPQLKMLYERYGRNIFHHLKLFVYRWSCLKMLPLPIAKVYGNRSVIEMDHISVFRWTVYERERSRLSLVWNCPQLVASETVACPRGPADLLPPILEDRNRTDFRSAAVFRNSDDVPCPK